MRHIGSFNVRLSISRKWFRVRIDTRRSSSAQRRWGPEYSWGTENGRSCQVFYASCSVIHFTILCLSAIIINGISPSSSLPTTPFSIYLLTHHSSVSLTDVKFLPWRNRGTTVRSCVASFLKVFVRATVSIACHKLRTLESSTKQCDLQGGKLIENSAAQTLDARDLSTCLIGKPIMLECYSWNWKMMDLLGSFGTLFEVQTRYKLDRIVNFLSFAKSDAKPNYLS